MKKFIKSAVLTVTLASASTTMACEFGTAEEAKNMLQRAVGAMAIDKEAALKAFTKGTTGFKDRDLYIACFEQGVGEKAVLTAHGASDKLVGTLAYDIVDKKGTNLGKILDNDTNGKIKSVTYWWPRPGQTEAVEKESFYTTFGGQNCLVGIYN